VGKRGVVRRVKGKKEAKAMRRRGKDMKKEEVKGDVVEREREGEERR